MSSLFFTERYKDFQIETHSDRDTGTVDYVVAYFLKNHTIRKQIDIDFFATDEDVFRAKEKLMKWVDLGERSKIKQQIVQETGYKTAFRKDSL